jgi:hypothetical protein
MSLKSYKETNATAAVIADPLLEKLKQDVDALIQGLESQIRTTTTFILAQIMKKQGETPTAATTSSTGEPTQQRTSLPWFKYGIRGFLNKLWHGNHPANPMWKREHNLTLEERAYLENEINAVADTVIDVVLLEADLDSEYINGNLAGLQQVFVDFRNKLIQLITTALAQKMSLASDLTASSIPSTKSNVNETTKNSRAWWTQQKDISSEQKKIIQSWVNGKTGKIRDEIRFRSKAVEFVNSRYHDKADPDTQLDPSNLDDVRLIWPKISHPLVSVGQPPVTVTQVTKTKPKPKPKPKRKLRQRPKVITSPQDVEDSLLGTLD